MSSVDKSEEKTSPKATDGRKCSPEIHITMRLLIKRRGDNLINKTGAKVLQFLPASGAEAKGQAIQVFQSLGKSHQTACLPAMGDPEGMGYFMHGHLGQAFIQHGFFRRSSIGHPAQTAEGNDSQATG